MSRLAAFSLVLASGTSDIGWHPRKCLNMALESKPNRNLRKTQQCSNRPTLMGGSMFAAGARLDRRRTVEESLAYPRALPKHPALF